MLIFDIPTLEWNLEGLAYLVNAPDNFRMSTFLS